ncbi:hypothetical protein HYPSUDRAFT_201776 [Hypholoma sublateritium FD-334 SS-4]|uniref:Fungal-type protein kinase domain-containing protein n=1 Tax=Hypholoma sublateritium (strain FD-334 SS-4) TaxID=945553 RepID=A0A0D2MH53_HYPSF|nr:hypothetical protein HYPSUDRAFT_201776 [Hypholoma sublateritium FD-334 SS-4]
MPQTFTEKHMEGWLNTVADMLGVAFGKVTTSDEGKTLCPTCERSWSSQTSNSPQTGACIPSKKPGLSLLDRDLCSTFKGKDDRPSWAVVKAFVEVTQATYDTSFSSVVRNIVEKAYIMFETQPFRRFVITLAFFGQPQTATARWMLVLVDRSGVISTSPSHLNGSGGYTLGHVLYYLSFASSHHIGIDETMTICKLTGVVTHITVTGQTPTSGSKMVKRIFEVERLLHTNSQISGCSTSVWLVRRKSRYYALKDSWPLESKPFSEIRHLMTINQTIMNDAEMRDTLKHTYPVLVIGQELGDSTDLRRQELPRTHLSRVHRRIVTKAIGDPLTSFRSKFELCSILCDVVYSAEKCKICHGDISLGNILINRIWDDDDDNGEIDSDDNDDNIESSSGNDTPSDVVVNESSASEIAEPGKVHTNSELNSSSTALSASSPRPVPVKARGLVIDHDNSFALDEVAESGYFVNTGTLPFMAVEALAWKKPSDFRHQPKHDLESLFYVLLNLCTYVDGVGCLRSPIPKAEELSVCLNEWWAVDDYHTLARRKASILMSPDTFILGRMPAYWDDFHQVLKDLYAVIWTDSITFIRDQQNTATHEAFLEVLIKAREMYREKEGEEGYTYASITERQAGPSGLRKRKEHSGHVSRDAKRRP